MQYCQKCAVIHRDLKLENLLLRVDDDGSIYDVKIADFGMAEKRNKLVISADHKSKKKIFGTIGYMAPEVVQDDQKYDHRIDTYSLGVILFNMVTREELYTGTANEIQKKTLN